MKQQLLHGKIICAGKLDDLYARNVELVDRRLKLPVHVLPEDDPALVEFLQWSGKSLPQRNLYGFCGHNGMFLSLDVLLQ